MTLSILVAPVAIPLLLGNKWEPAVVPLQFLMLASFARVMLVMLGPLAMALARTDLVMLWSAIIVGVTVLGFAIGLQWGIDGVAASYVVTSFLVVVPNAVHVGRAIGFDSRRFLLSAVPAAVASAVMAAVWFGVDAGVTAASGSDVRGRGGGVPGRIGCVRSDVAVGVPASLPGDLGARHGALPPSAGCPRRRNGSAAPGGAELREQHGQQAGLEQDRGLDANRFGHELGRLGRRAEPRHRRPAARE